MSEDYENALNDINKALKLNPNHSNSWNMRGLIYFAKEIYEKSIVDF
jgi:tetratricopeptide (TPR) repeat protein